MITSIPQNKLPPVYPLSSSSTSQVNSPPTNLIMPVAEKRSIKKNGIRKNGIHTVTTSSINNNYVLPKSLSPSFVLKNIDFPKLQSSEVSFKVNYDKMLYHFDKAFASLIDLGADLASINATTSYNSIMSVPARMFHNIRDNMDMFKDNVVTITQALSSERNSPIFPSTNCDLLDSQPHQQ
ncbi:hypothetical protein MXB_3490 [Myxobolus squamalis]|nr:hypothetical protein MXB_3490 [Myxobolus squamalis]